VNILELTKKAVELASQDKNLKEKIKDIDVSIEMDFPPLADPPLAEKNGEEQAISFSIDHGEIKLIEGKMENPDFVFEISKSDFTDLMTGKQTGLILMATKKLNMVKGSWAEISKIAAPLSIMPKFGKEIAKREGGL
jgi:hypothetical protein